MIKVRRNAAAMGFIAGLSLFAYETSWAQTTTKAFTSVTQSELNAAVVADPDAAFEEAFEHGDEMFDVKFNELDGSGARVGQNWPNSGAIGTATENTGYLRFTRTPRAQLNAKKSNGNPGEWATHIPSRATGPNGQACSECHGPPEGSEAGDGGNGIAANVHRDPLHTGNEFVFIQRNTPHLFAPGALQNLAEEITTELKNQRAAARTAACALAVNGVATRNLSSKGTSYGTIGARHVSGTGTGCVTSDITTGISGVNTNLVIQPYQWKGSTTFLRDFARGANHNELGMQGTELTGPNFDGDGDGVVNELSVGDMSALTIYLAAQPRPSTKIELNSLGLLATPLTTAEIAQINRGSSQFSSMGCAVCHQPTKSLTNRRFQEPSAHPDYRETVLPSGQTAASQNLRTDQALHFDLTADQPDNVLENPDGSVRFRLGSLRVAGGLAQVDLFGDMKRHDLGSEVAEAIDEAGTGASVFMTRPLWGVASTPPWMHDGRATTFEKAIDMHGSEGNTSRTNFRNASAASKGDLVAFLNNLVLFQLGEE